jgi:hypothetical protein
MWEQSAEFLELNPTVTTLTARLYRDKYGFKTNPRGTVGQF